MGAEKRLGHYVLLREVGRGGMAAVFEAVDTRLGRTVAVKVLATPPGAEVPDAREAMVARLQREARAIGSLSHPNVVTIFDVGEQDGLHFLVMEFLNGVTLRERLDHGPMSPFEAADIVTQVADGLDAVHARGLVHRDLKPSNVMLLPGAPGSEPGVGARVKLMDFGIARAADDTTMTQSGSMIGSPSYLAPEQIRGEKATPASDVWALGVLLYEMLAGRPPFAADSVPAVLYRIAHIGPAALPGVPPDLAGVLQRALEKDPAKRFGSARALADAVGAALETLPAWQKAASKPAKPRARAASSTRRMRAAATAAAVFLVGAAFAVARPKSAQQGPSRAAAHRTKTTPATPNDPTASLPSLPAPRQLGKLNPVSPPTTAVTQNDHDPTKVAVVVTARRVRSESNKRSVERTSSVKNSARGRKTEPRPQRLVVAVMPTPTPPRKAPAEPARPMPPRRVDVAPKPIQVAQTKSSGENPQAALRDLRDAWIAATNARDIDQQMYFYNVTVSKFYLRRNTPREAIRKEKERVFGRATLVDMRAGAPDIAFSPNGRTATMRFRKKYRIAGGKRGDRRGEVLQELRWQRTGESWKIIGERDVRVFNG